MRYFPENSSFFTVCLFDLASAMIIHPLYLGLNLAKIDLASAWHCKLYPPERQLTKANQPSLNLEGVSDHITRSLAHNVL